MEIFSSYSGADFLLIYAVMLATCVLAGLWIPANLRSPGRRGDELAMEEVAVLSGGLERHAQAVSADLLARGGLAAASAKTVRVDRDDLETGSAGRSVLRKVGEFGLREIGVAVGGDGQAIRQKLEARGLMMSKSEVSRLRWLSVLPYAALFAIGLYRQQAGEALGEPTGLLIGLLVLTFIFALIRMARFNARTMAGNEVIRKLEEESSRLRRAPQAGEAGVAVALFGTGVLVGTPWEPVHAMRQAAGGGDGGSSGDSGDGGGGCGGGCGGCGG